MDDSDDHFLPPEEGEEDEGGEEDTAPPTADDLLRWGREARQQQRAYRAGEALPADEDDNQPPEQPFPLATARQPLSSLPARPAPPTVLGRPIPLPAFQRQHFAPVVSQASPASAAPLSGWRSLRQHSHWLVPVVLVAFFFFLLLFTHPQQAGAMLFIFAAIGLVQAAILLYAPNDAFWGVGVVGGFLVFASATFFVLFLPIFALLLSILLLSLGGVALHQRYFPVREGTVAVMSLFGKYNRTLAPGFNLRYPGEKVLGIVETHSIRHDVHVPPIVLLSGEQVTLNVAITYQVVPGEEYQVIRLTRDWQKAVEQQLQAVVQDEISMLTIQDFRYPVGPQAAPGVFGGYAAAQHEQEASPLERINDHLTEAMQRKVAERGVEVQEVKVHLLESPHQPATMPAPAYLPPTAHQTVVLSETVQPMGPVVEGVAQPPPINGQPLYLEGAPGLVSQPAPPVHPAGPPVAPPLVGMGIPEVNAPPQMNLLSAQALAETYDAVVRHRISDLGTIQRIISQFEAVAADPELSQQVPFDAAAGARNLSNHLYHLQLRSMVQPGQQPNTDDTSASPGGPAGQEEPR